jgi:hypothetical protein
MSDEKNAPAQGGPEDQTAPPADTWEELGRQLSELGAAIAAAVKAAADDPENRRRAQELKEGLESAARDIGDAFSEVAATPQGERVKEAAGAVAAAGRKVADDVRPHLIDATRKAGDALREAASRIERGHGETGGDTAAGGEGSGQ